MVRKKKPSKPKKPKLPNIDGLGPKDIKKIRNALRQVWSWSHPRKLVLNRCLGADGFPYCEQCGVKAPKVFVDHILNVGDVDEGFISRLFIPSNRLQGLCKACHDAKTKQERESNGEQRGCKYQVKIKLETDDFY